MSLATALPVVTGYAPTRPYRVLPREGAAGVSRDDLRLLAVIATGIPLTSAAGRLGISDRTLRRRVRVICDDLQVTSLIEAVAWAARRGLI